MFKVELMVEDNKLAKLHWALDGLVVGGITTTPIRAAAVKDGRVVSTQPIPGATMWEQVVAILKKSHRTKISSTDLVSFIEQAGGKASSFTYIFTKLKEVDVLSASDTRGVYLVNTTES